MMSTRLMVWLGLNYIAIVVAALYERDWWRALYFFAALLITVAVLKMGNT